MSMMSNAITPFCNTIKPCALSHIKSDGKKLRLNYSLKQN